MSDHNTVLCHILNGSSIPQDNRVAVTETGLKDIVDMQLSQLKLHFKELERRSQPPPSTPSSPVASLPLELLGNAFLNAHPSTLDHAGRNDLLSLGLVCYRWRSATLLTPGLWSGISIVPDAQMDQPISFERVLVWLNRSGGRVPKTLEWHCPLPKSAFELCDGGHNCVASSPLLIRLLTDGPQLDHSTLACGLRPACFGHFLAALDAAAPSPATAPRPWDILRSFELITGDSHHQMDSWGDFYRGLPCVKVLRLSSTSLGSFGSLDHLRYGTPPTLGSFHIPVYVLSNLTSFTLHYALSGTHVFTALEHCANLEMLSVNAFRCNREPDEFALGYMEELRRAPLVLPKVHTLRVLQTNVYPFLQCLKAPSLRCLEIGDIRHRLDHGFDIYVQGQLSAYGLAGFLNQSGVRSTLKSLHFHALTISRDDMSTAFSNLVSLEHLTLNQVSIKESNNLEAWTAILLCGGGTFPSLTHLSLLRLPHHYPFLGVAAWLARRRRQPERLPCRVTVSYLPRPNDTENYFGINPILPYRDVGDFLVASRILEGSLFIKYTKN